LRGSIRGVEMNRMVNLYAGLAAAVLSMLAAASILAHGQTAPGDIQVFRNALETVYVFPRIGPVDRKGELVTAGDPTGQVKQALGHLRPDGIESRSVAGPFRGGDQLWRR
jgi:hypothetical protein